MSDAARAAPSFAETWQRVRAWARIWLRPRRRLRATGAGRVLIGLTLAVGFAAFNTGNNLLFFGWGLLLSSIVVSGILSEATLQAVGMESKGTGEARARTPGTVAFAMTNRRRVPAFAVEVRAIFDGDALPPARSFELRLAPGTTRTVELAFVPRRRGVLTISTARALTAFPFGFFEKEKSIELELPMRIVVLPGRVDVASVSRELLSRLGEAPARRQGPGDELFSLRPFRTGDDPRKIAWRRAAKTGRIVVKETEAASSNDVVLELVVDPGCVPADVDHAVDVCGSLAEDLLSAGHAVGLSAPGVATAPAAGPRQRGALLAQLALVDARAAMSPVPSRRAVIIAVVARGAHAPSHAGVVIDAERVARGTA